MTRFIHHLRRFAPATLLLGLVGSACEGPGDDACPKESGVACVWLGTGELGLSEDGTHRLDARLYWAMDVEFAKDGTSYVLDWNNHLVRHVDEDGRLQTVMGDFVGDGPPDESDLTEPGADGLTVSLNHPTDIQLTDDGHLILAAWHNHKIRDLDLATGLVTVLCGRGAGYAGDDMPVDAATLLNQPRSIVLDDDGSMYILDQRNFRIRRLTPGWGTIETVAGNGTPGFSGDGGLATDAQLTFEAGSNPEPSGGLAIDGDMLYIADGLNHRIRRVDLTTGIIDTVVGTGEAGDAGAGGPGLEAQINQPRDIEVGPDGRLYFADTENHKVKAWDPETGIVEHIAGSGENALGADGVPATQIALSRPMGIAFDFEGALYISDTYNSRIVRVEP